MNQHDEILWYLRDGNTLTVLEAIQRFGVYALSQRIGELKKQGHNIVSEMTTLPSGKRVAKYRLVPEGCLI